MVSRQRLDQPGAITGIARRLRSAERGANLGYSSITRGGIRVESADGIQVRTVAGGAPGMRVTGLQVVDGTLRITGTLDGGGTWSWTGTLDQQGSTFLRGPVRITGANGTLEVEAETFLKGVATLSADLIVGSGGKITAGNVTIEPNKIVVAGGSSPATLQDGALSFGTGGKVEADTAIAGIRMVAGDAVVNAGSTASVRKGNASVIAGPLGIDINAAALRLLINAPVNLTPGLIPTQTGTGLPVGTLLITSTGALRRAA